MRQGLNATEVAKYSYFGPFEGYISEMMNKKLSYRRETALQPV